MGVKKFLVLVALFTTIFSTCNAAQVRLSNIGAENFLGKMTALLQSDAMKKRFPITITTLIRDEKGDLPEYNLKAWGAYFAKSSSSEPEGVVSFFTDTSDCVNSMKFVFKITSDWAEKYEAMLMSALWTLDFTPDEAGQLIRGGETKDGVYTSVIRIDRQNKNFIIIMNKINDMVVVILMATDGQK